MNFKVQIVTDMARKVALFENYEAAEAAGYMLGHGVGGNQLRDELRGKPKIDGLLGPMWGGWRDANGEHVFLVDDYAGQAGEPVAYSPSKRPIDHYLVRYESQSSYDLLSR